MIADVDMFTEGVFRTYLDNGKYTQTDDSIKVVGVTSDDRVAGLGELIVKELGDPHHNPDFDFVVYTLSASSKEYIKWVKEQTMQKDPMMAFYNEKPPDELVKKDKKDDKKDKKDDKPKDKETIQTE